MESERKIILSFLFKRSGKNALKESDLYLPLSMELGWFSTKEAQEFVHQALEQGLLEQKEGLLQTTFPIETISIPVGFTPSKKIMVKEKKKQETILETIITSISEANGQSRDAIHEDVLKIAQEKHILPEIAALFVARGLQIPLDAFYADVEKQLFTENTK